MSRGRFITLEGGEGAGKSTQAKLLADRLRAKDIAVATTREPGGSPGAEEIRKLLVKGEPGRWDALTETLLMFAERADHVTHTIQPALAGGVWVICDRFTDSTYAYQGAGRGLPAETIGRIEEAVMGGFRPDLTLVLDLPAETGLQRAHARKGAETRFEKFDLAFHEKLRKAFHHIAKTHADRCVVIPAQGSKSDVAALVWQTVVKRFNL